MNVQPKPMKPVFRWDPKNKCWFLDRTGIVSLVAQQEVHQLNKLNGK